MKKHFVTFFSPGTFVAEMTKKEIDSWNVKTAVEMSPTILERHAAKPYAFQFHTQERGEILISNMECNGYERIIENRNSWKTVRPLNAEDIVLDVNFEELVKAAV